MPDCHTQDGLVDWHEFEHLVLDLFVTIPDFSRVLDHVLSEHFSVLLHQWLHGKLHEHLVAVVPGWLLDNLFLRGDVVVLAPHELLECLCIHAELLGDSWAQRVQCEGPIIQCRCKRDISFFWRV